MSSHAIDWETLSRSTDTICDHRGLSHRDVAQVLGISPSSLSRLKQGHSLEADALASLIAWLYPNSVPAWIVAKGPS